ncbi:primosomal replication protein [Actinobacillus equuli subsp. equuli]|uniref:primosomal replication protein PriC n=1 Tax=Actinobacillus equuli TaxID=718 RepID=UPI002443365D|nr:primosomal replication protein PriC [Actinobacillus equuli]WGE49360.1 primosomal replication protein [Actinobacillus equuli subsp. equuli]WGE55733.1 primosomal replication protein [Actinobacillus equuli subsp. equuli]
MIRYFPALVQKQLDIFLPFDEHEVIISENIFSTQKQKVSFFVQEIMQTANKLNKQNSEDYANAYAAKLFHQYEALTQAVKILKLTNGNNETLLFQSSFQFPKNIHSLAPTRRLNEYRKALRALNEKISWLVEKRYNASETEKVLFERQIKETEYRKMKCLKAIEDLEEQTQFK